MLFALTFGAKVVLYLLYKRFLDIQTDVFRFVNRGYWQVNYSSVKSSLPAFLSSE